MHIKSNHKTVTRSESEVLKGHLNSVKGSLKPVKTYESLFLKVIVRRVGTRLNKKMILKIHIVKDH